jgi:hypothetical protein
VGYDAKIHRKGGSPRTLYHLAVFGAFLFHFVRRIFEVSFVNSYSRPTPLHALVFIAFLYGGIAACCAFFQVRTFGQPVSVRLTNRGVWWPLVCSLIRPWPWPWPCPSASYRCCGYCKAALAAARQAEDSVMKGEKLGPLHGIPFSVKVSWQRPVKLQRLFKRSRQG